LDVSGRVAHLWVPHLRDGLIVAKVGIARRARPLLPISKPPALLPLHPTLAANNVAKMGHPFVVVYTGLMPLGLKRYQTMGHDHLVTFSCYQRRPYLQTPEARDLFERSLEQARKKYAFDILAYVVMPEHVHLLISEPATEPLSKALQAIKLSVSKQSTERPFWQDRYHDFNVFTQPKRVEKIRYLHRNPVARGLVLEPEDWPHSSFLTYLHNEQRTVFTTLL
jgi:putative transposase